MKSADYLSGQVLIFPYSTDIFQDDSARTRWPDSEYECTTQTRVQQINWSVLWLSDMLKLWTGFFRSEKFMVKLNKNGGPKNPEKVDRLCALFTVTFSSVTLDTALQHISIYRNIYLNRNVTYFTSCICLQDLSSKDLKRDLYIVAHVIRTGKCTMCRHAIFVFFE